ncbi:MAG TPA: YjjW family glycine radical enzyme activase [Feifaniaceae bacterium]|nr:YjjW family glycine radical enzyme activase [Feifaniaceae bacterium]
MRLAPVNRIIDQSSVDGPGNRTALFLQGCNFTCGYCHNPETINACVHCGDCVAACPAGALRMENGSVLWNASLCRACDACLAACTYRASPKITRMTPEQALERIQRNIPFIRGVTFSGGECTLWRDFLYEVSKGTKALGLTALYDSNGSYDFSADPALLSVSDGVMLDVKCFDAAAHTALTGEANDMVLKNLRFLADVGKLTEVRTVVVPNALPNADTVEQVCRILSPYWKAGSPIAYKLIRFRPLGVRGAYEACAVPDDAELEALARIARRAGCERILIL